jgi:hypothetical protein
MGALSLPNALFRGLPAPDKHPPTFANIAWLPLLSRSVMTNVESLRKALAGMQKIELEIIGQVQGRGVPIEAKNFTWNHGRPLAGLPPASVHMDVHAGSRQASADWERIQLGDSSSRIARPDVLQEIDRIVEKLAPARLPPSNKPFEIK